MPGGPSRLDARQASLRRHGRHGESQSFVPKVEAQARPHTLLQCRTRRCHAQRGHGEEYRDVPRIVVVASRRKHTGGRGPTLASGMSERLSACFPRMHLVIRTLPVSTTLASDDQDFHSPDRTLHRPSSKVRTTTKACRRIGPILPTLPALRPAPPAGGAISGRKRWAEMAACDS